MAVPGYLKTWQFANVSFPAQATNILGRQNAMRLIKDTMVAFTNGWAIDYTCDSSVAGTKGDNVDRWDADTDCVWVTPTGSPHSWAVFDIGLSTGGQAQVCIDLLGAASGSNSGDSITLVFSPSAGFTGGTVNDRPTATDETVLKSGTTDNFLAVGTASLLDYSGMFWCSSDGENTRILLSGNSEGGASSGNLKTETDDFWGFETIGSVVAGAPAFAVTATPLLSTTWGTVATWNDAAVWASRETTPGNFVGFASGEGIDSQLLIERLRGPNTFSGEWYFGGMGFVSEAANAQGQHGIFKDMYWAQTDMPELFMLPDVAAGRWVKVKNVWLPWDVATAGQPRVS